MGRAAVAGGHGVAALGEVSVLRRRFVTALVLALAASAAEAQIMIGRGPYGLTVEGFANVTAGRDAGSDAPYSANGWDVRLDGAFRLVGLVNAGDGFAFGPRVIVQSAPQDTLGVGERSLLFQGKKWGRFELGYRQGLPDVLIGYAPNSFTFAGAEYGPATGPGLDPDGRLPTAFLDPALGSQIDAMSYLGFASALYLDPSAKLIYVSPRKKGWLAGVGFAPNVEDRSGPYRQLVQTGLVYEGYTEHDVFRVGATYTFAAGQHTSVGRTGSDDLSSVSLGATVVLHEKLILGVSGSYNGRSGLDVPSNAARPLSTAYGYSASVNYNTGPWTFGGYFQSARAEGDVALPGQDQLRVLQLGGSYRFERRLRLYGAGYRYRFIDEDGRGAAIRPQGAVLVFGVRATL